MSAHAGHCGQRWSAGELWGFATTWQRSGAVAGGIALVVLAALSALDTTVLPLAAAALVVDALLVHRFATQQRSRRDEERRVSEETERGLRELERWLASGENA